MPQLCQTGLASSLALDERGLDEGESCLPVSNQHGQCGGARHADFSFWGVQHPGPASLPFMLHLCAERLLSNKTRVPLLSAGPLLCAVRRAQEADERTSVC